MANIETCIDLPVSGSGCIRFQMDFSNLHLNVKFVYEDRNSDEETEGVLEFKYAIYYKYTDEMHSFDRPETAYDAVVRLNDSDWLKEFLGNEPKGLMALGARNHYYVYLSNCGAIDVVADSVTFSVL